MVFKVELDCSETDLFKLLKTEDANELGYMPLPEGPLTSVQVISKSNGDVYALDAIIVQDIGKFLDEVEAYNEKASNMITTGKAVALVKSKTPDNIKIPKTSLEKIFERKDLMYIRNNVFVLDSKGKPEYDISEGTIINGMFAPGLTLDFGNGTTRAKKLTNSEDVGKVFKKFSTILEALVNGAYQENNTPDTDIILYLRPPFKMQAQNERAIRLNDSGKAATPYDDRGNYL